MTRIHHALIHEPYALPIALARSYESFVLSEIENPSDCRVNRVDWTSSCVGLMVGEKDERIDHHRMRLVKFFSKKGREASSI